MPRPTARDDVERVLLPGEQIASRVAELAEAITTDHSPPNVSGEAEVTIVPVLTGALVFAADLIRAIPLPIRINLVAVSSYPGRSISSVGPTVLAEDLAKQLGDVQGRHVVLVDDILDSGRTLAALIDAVGKLEPASVRTCVLLRKELPQAPAVEADYVGFAVPDEFVVGYGLDFDGRYRNLPDVAVLSPRIFAGSE
jgi:hypoxanthine phosphoribosyltransferase